MKILLLGSGELGKEFVIAAKRLGQTVIAVDSYNDAPAQQVADEREVINMLDGKALDEVVFKHNPDFIVPEIEAIRTERFYEYEKKGIHVVPSARAANFTMNRKAIRDLASKELGLRTAKYSYATTLEEFKTAVHEIGIPCVVKPLMSSSGKGQSVVKTENDIEKSWNYALSGSRGDYQESWMPHPMSEKHLQEAQDMAEKVTRALTGEGIWGVEFFLAVDGVYFSELSPRPHDTGMVTLANTIPLNEFELHLRAILGLPIPDLTLLRAGASAVVLASKEGIPKISGLENALNEKNVDVKIFGKPITRPYRRIAVALSWDEVGCDITQLVEKAKTVAGKIKVN